MNKQDKKTIRGMLEYIDRALDYVKDSDATQFMNDLKTRDAVSFCLQQIGDQLKNVSPEGQMANPHISWRGISAFRNRIVHNYKDVAMQSLWVFLQRDLPQLQKDFVALLDEK